MRISPVNSASRANVRRKSPYPEERETKRKAGFTANLPVPVQPDLQQTQQDFVDRYLPNSVFLAHLIAMRDDEIQTGRPARSEPLRGADSYRTTAALPRQRLAGHLLKTER